jgi:putative ABC transport system ATP-binding protein
VAYIELKNLRKEYHLGVENVKALDGVSFEIHRGEFLSITGPSGSGKSTLMHIIGALDNPTDGTYVLDGQEISGKPLSSLVDVRRHSIGFVFQTFNLLPRMSALDNVALPLVYQGKGQKERRRRAQEALARVHLDHRTGHRPNELSGGERQRVAIARALVADPKLILADEPTGNLDSKTSEEILKLFLELNREDATIVLVTHEPELAQVAKRSVRLLDGKVEKIIDGTKA